MKKIELLSLGLITFLLFSGCENESLLVPEQTVTTAIQKIQTLYEEGDIKVETYLQSGEEKIVNKDINHVEKYPIPQKEIVTRSGLESYVGVLKQKGHTCGQYSELKITIDCEDHNTDSNQRDWTGASGVVGNGNVDLYFCLVPQTNFHRIKGSHYAVLKLGSGTSNTIVRKFDNEDSKTWNSYYLNGVEINANELPNVLGPGINQDGNGNTTLTFQFYEADINGVTSFPDFGVEYGVIGKINTIPIYETGYLFIDEEDDYNWSQMWFNGTLLGENISGYPGLNLLFYPHYRDLGIYMTRVK